MHLFCRFNFKNYPFDTQNCSITFFLESTNSKYAYLSMNNFSFPEYNEPYEYKFISYEINCFISNNLSFVKVTFSLQNKTGYYFGFTFIPTSLLVIISFFAWAFDERDFDDRITVTMSSLLILVTLFSYTSSDLPMFSTMKLLNIWFIACITTNFIIIVFICVLNHLKNLQIEDCSSYIRIFFWHLNFYYIKKLLISLIFISFSLFVVIYTAYVKNSL